MRGGPLVLQALGNKAMGLRLHARLQQSFPQGVSH